MILQQCYSVEIRRVVFVPGLFGHLHKLIPKCLPSMMFFLICCVALHRRSG